MISVYMKNLSVALFLFAVVAGLYLNMTNNYFYRQKLRGIDNSAEGTSSVLFVGDIMFDRAIRGIADDKGYLYLFSCVKDVLLAQGTVVGNLEGPITKNKSVSKGTKPGNTDNFQFTFDPQVTDALLLSNIGYLNIGNNHIFNFGREGLADTKKYLTKAGIKYFGDPLEVTTSVAHISLPGREIALINYNQFCCDTPELMAEAVGKLVETEKNEGRFVVVYAHWGEEYATSSNSVQQKLAHTFIEFGADAVIGSHPHVVQEVEEYLGRLIFYSLGNFIFDQWFSDDTMLGMGVRLSFSPNSKSPHFETIMFTLNKDGTTCSVI